MSLTQLSLTIILNSLQQHVSTLKNHLQAEYKGAYKTQYHKMGQISLKMAFKSQNMLL
jgi:uncharacterized protein (DUF2249 family)